MIGPPKGGASTIEMQFVRTVTHRRERTVRRKIREMLLATELRKLASKQQILTAYLNLAYFGYEQRGSEAAALSAFRSEVSGVCFARKAFIAALLVRPLPRSRTLTWYKLVFARTRWIMSRVARSSAPLD
jgi:monofunctional glycosyltransferase